MKLPNMTSNYVGDTLVSYTWLANSPMLYEGILIASNGKSLIKIVLLWIVAILNQIDCVSQNCCKDGIPAIPG